MDTGVVIERVQRVAAARVDVSADRTGIEAGLRDVSAIRAWCDASEADLVRQLAEVVSFPEAVITDATHDSTTNAAKTIERSKTLDAAVDLASALDDGTITAGHVDAVTRAAGGLDAGQRESPDRTLRSPVDVRQPCHRRPVAHQGPPGGVRRAAC